MNKLVEFSAFLKHFIQLALTCLEPGVVGRGGQRPERKCGNPEGEDDEERRWWVREPGHILEGSPLSPGHPALPAAQSYCGWMSGLP